jgi:hypothetical protein
MPLKSAAASKRRNDLFAFCVIALSVTIVAVLAATVLSHLSATSKGQIAGKKAVSSLSHGFSCTADVTLDGTAYEVKLNKAVGGDSTMKFVKPQNLSTLSFSKGDDGIKVKLGSLEMVVDEATIPQSSVFNAVLGAFETCVSKSVSANSQGKDTTLSGSSSAGAFTMVFDSSVKPKSLSIPTLKLTAKFKDFKYS